MSRGASGRVITARERDFRSVSAKAKRTTPRERTALPPHPLGGVTPPPPASKRQKPMNVIHDVEWVTVDNKTA